MTSTVTSTSAEQIVNKHPIRGGVWGLLLGIGITIYLVLFSIVAFGDWIPLGACVLAGVVVGVVWAYVAPAKQPKDLPPLPQPADRAAPKVDLAADSSGTAAEQWSDSEAGDAQASESQAGDSEDRDWEDRASGDAAGSDTSGDIGGDGNG